MGDIALTIITIDRSPRENYLPQTVENLRRGGVLSSPRLHSAHIVNSDERSQWIDPYRGDRFIVYEAHVKRTPPQNAAAALQIGAGTGAPWVLFCEDDIDVCADFLDSVGRWLDRYAEEKYRVFSFGAAYAQILTAKLSGREFWEYPVDAFYGTTCFAIRNADARSLGQYWFDHHTRMPYDLLVHEWMADNYSRYKHFLTSAPSFVQHCGRQSEIAKTRQVEITYDSWPGREWSYK